MGKIYIGDLFSKKVTKRRPIWAKSLLWGLSILKGDPFGNTETDRLIDGARFIGPVGVSKKFKELGSTQSIG